MSTRRLRALVSTFCCFAALFVCGQPASATSRWQASEPGTYAAASPRASDLSSNGQPDLAQLRQRAESTRKKLERGTKKWEKGRTELARTQQRLSKMEKELAAAERRLDRLRGPVAEIANAAYQSPTASNVATLIAAERPQSALRAAANLRKMELSRSALIHEAAQTHARLLALTEEATDLRKEKTAEADRLARLIQDLQRESAAATEELTAALREAGANGGRLERSPSVCDPEQARRARQHPNGLVPSAALCALPQSGHRLRADAALAFHRMNAAYAARFGQAMCVTDSYRTLAEQQRIYAQRPGMSAVPGRSLHGVGIAVDLCGGVQQYGSVQYGWMVANAERFGWYHPAWATGSQFEPWHWEFDPDSGASLS